jgi:hypothetical protein
VNARSAAGKATPAAASPGAAARRGSGEAAEMLASRSRGGDPAAQANNKDRGA